MTKTAMILGLFAETHIHVGIGQADDGLDLPVARERVTHYPFIPGSGVKGAFRVWAAERGGLTAQVDMLFGPRGQSSKDEGNIEAAGTLLCSDARLLLLPVRCTSDAYKWVTCPAILQRLERDGARAGTPLTIGTVIVEQGKYLAFGTTDTSLGLEEQEFSHGGDVPPAVKTALAQFVPFVPAADVDKRLVVLSDKDFTWFARNALPVMARNVLDEGGNKKSENLWYEESLPPETVMYALFGERMAGAVNTFSTAINTAPYIQMGGNETIGQGWFKMQEIWAKAESGVVENE